MAGEIETTIKPSPEARHLFNAMVARAGKNLHLTMEATLELAVERTKRGLSDTHAINELKREEWIDPAQDGGWLLH